MHEFDTIFGKLQIFEEGDQFDCTVLTIEPGKETSRHYDKKVIVTVPPFRQKKTT